MLIEKIDFRYLLTLIFLNEKKYGYNSYDLVNLLSLDYDTLRVIYRDLLNMELIVKDERFKTYALTKEGFSTLKKRNLLNFDLDSLIERNFNDFKNDEKILYKGNIFYLPEKIEF